jgi:hypothetical protein
VNLIPSGRRPGSISDGGWILYGLAVRAGLELPEPEPEPDPAPADSVADYDGPVLRPPFVIALVLLMLFFLIAGGVGAFVVMGITLVVFLGVPYLMGAHRSKIF